MEVERTKRPTLVSRCSSGNKLPPASRSSVMVLNLITRNIFPSLPGRSCRKKAPAPLLAKCNQTVMTRSIGQMANNTQRTMMKSINRLKKCLYINKRIHRAACNAMHTATGYEITRIISLHLIYLPSSQRMRLAIKTDADFYYRQLLNGKPFKQVLTSLKIGMKRTGLQRLSETSRTAQEHIVCIAMSYAIDILEKVLFSKSLNSYRITSNLACHSCKFIGVGQRHEDFLENITGIDTSCF